MSAPDLDARRVTWDQRARDAIVGTVTAEQVVGIIQLEGEPDDGSDRSERDVALRKVEPDDDRLTASVDDFAYHACVGDRGGIRACAWAGQREAGDLFTPCKPRQVILALFLRAVMQEQFGRPQRVRHRHRGADSGRTARKLHEDTRVRVSGKLQTAV